jgi:outer membrane protein
MDLSRFSIRAVALAAMLLSAQVSAGEVKAVRIAADDAGIELHLDAEVGTLGRAGMARDGRHFVIELQGFSPERLEALLARLPKPSGIVSEVFARPLAADGARLVLALTDGVVMQREELVYAGQGQVRKLISLTRASVSFDLRQATAQVEANGLNLQLSGAERMSLSARQIDDNTLSIEFEELKAARAQRVLQALKGPDGWLSGVEVVSQGQGSRATVRFARPIELVSADSQMAGGQAQWSVRLRPAATLDADGIVGVSLKGFAAELGIGPATIRLLAPVGVTAEAGPGLNALELRVSLRGVSRKRAAELATGFRSANPDVLGATVVSGDQRSSVVAFQLAKPPAAWPVVRTAPGGDTLVLLGREDAAAAASAPAPALAATARVAPPATVARAMVLGPVEGATSAAAPQPPAPAAAGLGLMKALEIAQERDPRLLAARHELRAQEEATAQARAGALPRVALDAQANRVNQAASPVGGVTTDRAYPTRDMSLSITQPLYRLANQVQRQQAEVVVEQARLAFAAAEQDLMVRLTTGYLNVLAGQDAVNLAQAEREALDKQYQLAITRQRSGLANVTEVSDTEARFAVSRAREVEAANALADARMALKEIIGVDVVKLSTEVKAFEPVLPTPQDPAAWQAAALKQNLALRLRERAVEIATLDIRKQKAGYAPSLDLVGSAGRNHQGQFASGGQFTGGFDSNTRSVGVRLSWPLFEGGMTDSLVREATARLSKVEQEAEAERLKVERQAGSSLLAINASVRKIEALGVSLAAQETALLAKTLGVQAGLFNVVQVADAYRLMYAAKREFLQARYDYLLNRIKLKQSIGTLTRQDVADMAELLK